MAAVKKTSAGSGQRVILFDEIRGFAIICMVVYHTMFQLKYSFGVDVPIFFENWFDVIRDIFAGAFIFISGVMCRYSRNNLKRGVQCFFLGMAITFIVPFFGSHILFGILHFLGVCMMIYGLAGNLFEKLPSTVGLISAVLLFILTMNIPREYFLYNGEVFYNDGFFGIKGLFEWNITDAAYVNNELAPLGFFNSSFASDDYFPLLPWIFVFIGGSYFGGWAKAGVLPRFFYNSHIKWLANVGRYTIWVYMLHIPIIYLICTLVFHWLVPVITG